jgi:hypothetical protein
MDGWSCCNNRKLQGRLLGDPKSKAVDLASDQIMAHQLVCGRTTNDFNPEISGMEGAMGYTRAFTSVFLLL